MCGLPTWSRCPKHRKSALERAADWLRIPRTWVLVPRLSLVVEDHTRDFEWTPSVLCPNQQPQPNHFQAKVAILEKEQINSYFTRSKIYLKMCSKERDRFVSALQRAFPMLPCTVTFCQRPPAAPNHQLVWKQTNKLYTKAIAWSRIDRKLAKCT